MSDAGSLRLVVETWVGLDDGVSDLLQKELGAGVEAQYPAGRPKGVAPIGDVVSYIPVILACAPGAAITADFLRRLGSHIKKNWNRHPLAPVTIVRITRPDGKGGEETIELEVVTDAGFEAAVKRAGRQLANR